MVHYATDGVLTQAEFQDVVRTATKVVAASDASAASKGLADYVCNSVADDVQIQAAIDALTNGGTVFLSEGVFNISNTLLLPGGITLRGSGIGVHTGYFATKINLSDGSDCDMIQLDGSLEPNFGTIRDLQLYGNYTNQASGHGVVIAPGGAYRADVLLENLLIWNCKEDGVRIETGWFHRFLNLWIEYCNIGLHCINGDTVWLFNVNINNCRKNCIYLDNFDSADAEFQMFGGQIGTGVEHSVVIDNSLHTLFNGVHFHGGGKAADTWDDIYIENASKDVRIKVCCFRGKSLARYVVNIQDTSNFIFATGNYIENHTAAQPFNVVAGANQNGRIWEQHSDLFMDVLAVAVDHVRNNEDLSAGIPITFTIDAQPDVPRTLSWTLLHANITEYDMEVIGVDAKGNTITETWDETAGWSGETSNAFATITSIKMTTRTGTGIGDTMDIGITDVLGLSNVIYATGDVYKIKKNTANEMVAGAQVNTTYDTYDMAVIGLGGGDDFTIWFRSNLNIIA